MSEWDCDVCEFQGFSDASIRMHKARKHGVMKGSTAKKSTELVVVRKPAQRKQTQWEEIKDFKVLSDGKGGVWLAERIK